MPPFQTKPWEKSNIWVTGIGLVTPLGMFREETWRNLKAGRSAARVLDVEPAEGAPPYLGCPVPSPDHRAAAHLFKATREAALDAGVRARDGNYNRARLAAIIGMSKGEISKLAESHRGYLKSGPSSLKNFPLTWPSNGAATISKIFGFRGMSMAPVAACATGVVALIQAVEYIRLGLNDIVFAGCGDASLEPFILGAYRRMRVLAGGDGDPKAAARPWDKSRTGFVPGEGAAVLVLEREDHARARGVLPYAEVVGVGQGSDAYSMTTLDPDPSALARVIRRALRDGKVRTAEIDYVNVHGTATKVNDPVECQGIRMALGKRADKVVCSANKPQIGHLLGASGAAELAITCLAIRDGFVPPTINLTDPDPACNLDGTPLVGRPLEIRTALKTSIGLGAHLAAAILRRPPDIRRPPVVDPDA